MLGRTRSVESTGLVACAFFTFFGSVAANAAILVVDPAGGGAFTTIQAAIQAAQPGDVLKILGGTYGPITIDKPLTLIGAPAPTIEYASLYLPNEATTQHPAIRLAGPGTGKVVLHGLRVRGAAHGNLFFHAGVAIGGKGFSSVELHHCDLVGASWTNVFDPRVGASGVSVETPFLLLEHCVVGGSPSVGSHETEYFCLKNAVNGATAIRVSDPPGSEASALVLDSVVLGGRGSTLCFWKSMCWLGEIECPNPSWPGKGGVGVSAHNVFVSGSEIRGGVGGGCTCSDPYVIYPAGSQGYGAPIAANALYSYPAAVDLSSPLAPGDSATLQWSTPAAGLLFVGLGTTQPLFVPGAGWLALEPSGLIGAHPLPAGPGQVGTTIPAQPSLFGIGLAIQAWDPVLGLSRPTVDTIYGGDWRRATAVALDLPKPIVPGVGSTPGTTQTTLSIANLQGVVEDVEVAVSLFHGPLAWISVLLVHPDGTSVTLKPLYGDWGSLLDTRYGTLTPAFDDFDVLDGKSPNGAWTLRVLDHTSTWIDATPTLLRAELRVTSR